MFYSGLAKLCLKSSFCLLVSLFTIKSQATLHTWNIYYCTQIFLPQISHNPKCPTAYSSCVWTVFCNKHKQQSEEHWTYLSSSAITKGSFSIGWTARSIIWNFCASTRRRCTGVSFNGNDRLLLELEHC